MDKSQSLVWVLVPLPVTPAILDSVCHRQQPQEFVAQMELGLDQTQHVMVCSSCLHKEKNALPAAFKES